MLDPKQLDSIARQIQQVIPKGVRDLGDEFEKKIILILQAQLSKLNLITKDEFDIQTQVLIKTREKLTRLEQRVNALELKLNSTNKPHEKE